MGEALGQFLRATGLERRMGEQRVLSAWSAVVGPERALRARAVRCRNGELLVEVDSAALLQELKNFTGEGLRRAVNQRLGGGEPIQRVSFQPRR
jgi:predicted nucleic acid-binding Zn ribbon protein